MKISEWVTYLEQLSPPGFAEPWDQVGLHVGDPAGSAERALLCIDLTEAVADEAISAKAGLIVAYHPPIFQPLPRLTEGDWKQRTLRKLIKADVAVYSPHTALDAAEGGVNDWLADGLGEGERRPIRPISLAPKQVKIVSFVPPAAADKLRQALARAGAGQIGDYSECSFTAPGEGTFRGDPTTNPTVGQPGRFERAEELRMEMVAPAGRAADVAAALRSAHPYEEAPIDIYPLASADESPRTGPGRVITLSKPVSLSTLIGRVKKRLKASKLDVGQVTGKRSIRTVGLCPGAGGSLLEEAGPLDAYITGEMRHHDVLDAVQRGTHILLAGHTETERPYLATYRKRIEKLLKREGRSGEVAVSKADSSPSGLR